MLRGGERVVYETHGNALLVKITGEIDHHSAVLVRTGIDEQLIKEQPSEVLLDLSGVDFMDSSGLGLIMGRYALVKQYGGMLSILDPSPAVVKIIKLAGLESRIPIKRKKENKQ